MWLLIVPFLSLVIFGAHLLFHGWGMFVAILPVVIALTWFVPKRFVLRLHQLLMLVIAGEWIYTAFQLAHTRMMMEQPWMRASLILGGVALFALIGTACFESKRLKNYFSK